MTKTNEALCREGKQLSSHTAMEKMELILSNSPTQVPKGIPSGNP